MIWLASALTWRPSSHELRGGGSHSFAATGMNRTLGCSNSLCWQFQASFSKSMGRRAGQVPDSKFSNSSWRPQVGVNCSTEIALSGAMQLDRSCATAEPASVGDDWKDIDQLRLQVTRAVKDPKI